MSFELGNLTLVEEIDAVLGEECFELHCLGVDARSPGV